MDELYKEYVISHFNKTLQMHGDRSEAVGWSSKGQHLRFEALLGIAPDREGKKVLDYGCGKGDLYQFLKDKNIPVSYTGFDINGNLLDLAKRKFPECEFRVFDMEHDVLEEDFDYIFLCGVFNLKVEGLDVTIRKILRKLFDHCRTALVFNALSSHSPDKSFELHYVCPEDLLEYVVKNISPHASLVDSGISDDLLLVIRSEKPGVSSR